MKPVVDPTTGEVLGPATPEDGDELDGLQPFELRQMAEAYRRQSLGLQRDLEGVEKEARNYRRKIKALEDELAEQRQTAPESQVVRTIFSAWVEATGRNRKTTKLGAAREKAVLARLREGHEAERILRAVKIGVQGANVSDRDAERLALIRVMREAVELVGEANAQYLRRIYREALGRVTRYDDLELICRSEVTLERFAALADVFDPPHVPAAEAGEQAQLVV